MKRKLKAALNLRPVDEESHALPSGPRLLNDWQRLATK